MKFFLNLLCCTNIDDKDIISDIPKEKSKEQERNLLNIYGNTMDGNYLLVRITQKNFFVDMLQRKRKKDSAECPQQIYYSLYEKGARYENTEQLIPEKVLQYVGRRASEVSPKLIVDGLSRSGSSTIQLCLEANCLVLGFNPSINCILNSQWNARIYNVNITDFIQAQIPHLPFKKCDIFYINPDFDVPNDEPFQINTMLRPNIKEIMMSGLTNSKNMIIMLPQFVSLHEKDHFKIEIQQIQVDGILTNYIFYLGEIAALAQQNELQLMTELCIEDTTADIHNQAYELIKKLTKSLKPKSILDMILYCQQQAQQDSETTYMSFLHRLLQRKLISQFEYNQLQVIEQAQTPFIDIQQQDQTFGYANNVVNYQYSLILINPEEWR
ncbi:hypothetical protein pb186bvf_000565 [Paramecium bursaria]